MGKEFFKQAEQLEPLNISEVLVAGNRGPCGGVNMTLEAVNQVLDIVDGREPVYTNWDPVHNNPIVQKLEKKGLINIKNNWDEIPNNSIIVFSAHGVVPSAYETAKEKKLHIIDTTCPLVTRVHMLAKRAEDEQKHIVYVGKNNHPETIGVMGEVKQENISLIENAEDVKKLELPAEKNKVVYSQTTLSTDEIKETLEFLGKKFPEIEIPNRWDICYATDNRQAAVDELLTKVDFLMVVGSQKSHNSQELKRKGDKKDITSILIDDASQIRRQWFMGAIDRVGVTSGASVLEEFTEGVLDWFRNEEIPITYLAQVIEEKNRTFKLPEAEIDTLRIRFEN